MTTVWADWGFMFIAGLIFGWGTSAQLERSGSIFLNRYFLAALLFQTFFCMPLSIYCYVIFPDWSWMYWLDADKVPMGWVIMAFLGYYIAMTMGFGLSAIAEQAKPGRGTLILRLAVLAFMAFMVIFYRRLFFVGTIEDFRAGTLTLFARIEPLFVLLVLGFALAIVVLLYLLIYLGRDLDRPWSNQDQDTFQRRRRIVSVVRVEGDVKAALRNSLEEWDGLEYLRGIIKDKGPRILIKPNLAGGGKGLPGTQTSPEFLAAAIDLIREVERDAEILVVESGSIFWWDLEPCFSGSEHERVLAERSVRFVNLSKEQPVMHDMGGRFGRELLPALLFEPHVLVDLPVAKTHGWYRMTGAVKNLFGLTPTPHKLIRYHTKGFADPRGQVFIDLYRAFPPDIVMMDGIISGEGDGPFGSPRKTDFIITSDDALCADFLLAEIMGYPVKAVPYLAILAEQGFWPEFERRGIDIREVRPAQWQKPSPRIISMFKNLIRILEHHRSIKKLGTGEEKA